MEDLVGLYGGRYRGRRVLVTGHTGFKGSWLSLWLRKLGADVIGVSLPPETNPSHWELIGPDVQSHYCDIVDHRKISGIIEEAQPEVVFHMAAQALVRRSYNDPIETWKTNTVGTASVLEACRKVSSVEAIVCVTTDKCYQNNEWDWGYRETDRLGGHDPYSASKAGTELVAASYRNAFLSEANVLLATARAGNVIGGGDWSQDRLIPDLARAAELQSPLVIRSPNATRPWQHVLDCLSGYLLLGQRLIERDTKSADAFNFGPRKDGNRSVVHLLEEMTKHWPNVLWKVEGQPSVHEATLLYLDCSKAHASLSWEPVWDFADAVKITAQWYRHWLNEKTVCSEEQLDTYCSHAREKSVVWCNAI